MADVHTREQRSFNISRIKGKDTKPEMLVRKYLHAQGFRYKLHDKTLPGKPDLVLPKYTTVIFIHGCFWHGHHNCKYFIIPKTRSQWWTDKISSARGLPQETPGFKHLCSFLSIPARITSVGQVWPHYLR